MKQISERDGMKAIRAEVRKMDKFIAVFERDGKENEDIGLVGAEASDEYENENDF